MGRLTFCKAMAVGTAAALATAGAAQAVTVVGAKSITVKNALPDYLQVAELLAFDFGGQNVALASNGGVATALSRYPIGEAPEGGPGEANDGVYPADFDYSATPVVPGVYHSAGAGPSEFLTITFSAATTLASVAIYGRGDCCETRDLYDVTIHGAAGEVLFTGRLDARTTGYDSVSFDRPVAGVPEPAAWTMMILGFGGAGVLLRRRPGAGRLLPA
ncbi:MAG: PEP-CTERM sorting domain-containing protein [Phenylobacterium sp.]|uniref:PEPxxWA-CTERM sorting domain-containing protein n=1 Tax=Phenylobacterium sp. TaxID=1871053 RepID=UPI001A3C36D0|nr:PEPxxWA-CTERM sorting domain-containing protein [Phenylobacterium sp.]MBL8772949.1 PEP-CTERM sorting domain-containing protein [Phenylobacterium sp.]